MGAPLAIRTDLEAAELRRLARRERDGRVAARLIALANALDGMGREAAARSAGNPQPGDDMAAVTAACTSSADAVVVRSNR